MYCKNFRPSFHMQLLGNAVPVISVSISLIDNTNLERIIWRTSRVIETEIQLIGFCKILKMLFYLLAY